MDFYMQNKRSLKNGLKKVGLRKRKQTNKIIIDCTNTPDYLDVTLKQLDKQHRQEGVLGLKTHYIITLDGKVQTGRELNSVGYKIPPDAVSILLVGASNFNLHQLTSLRNLVQELKALYGALVVTNKTTTEIKI